MQSASKDNKPRRCCLLKGVEYPPPGALFYSWPHAPHVVTAPPGNKRPGLNRASCFSKGAGGRVQVSYTIGVCVLLCRFTDQRHQRRGGKDQHRLPGPRRS